MTGRPCQSALATFHKNVSNPTQNVGNVIKKDAAALQRPLNREDDLGWPPRALWPCSAERVFLFVVPKRLRAFWNYFFTGGGVAWNGICCKNLRFASCKKGLLRSAAAPEGYVIAAQTSKLGSSFSMWMLDIKALCSGSVNSASFTYLFSTAAVRMGSAMVPAPPMQPPGQPMPSSR